MPRPGFVLEVDRSTPPILFHHGDRLRLERLPVGRSRVLYPPEPLDPVAHVGRAIAEALAAPLGGSAPLAERLRPGVKLTVSFDDVSSPVPPARGPDVRQRAIEQVLELAAAAGVDDVALVAARGLRRRLSEPELRQLLGDRVYESFAPHGLLVNHDAEDPDALEVVGTTAEGEDVELNARAARSDLLVHVGIATVPTTGRGGAADGGWSAVIAGLAGFRTSRHHPEVAAVGERMGAVLTASGVDVFLVEVTLDDDVYGLGGPLGVLQRREWEWSPRDRATFALAQQGLAHLPASLRRRLGRSWRAPFAVTSVHAGEVAAVHAAATERVLAQHVVPVDGQTDIATIGLTSTSPYSVGSTTNPLLVADLALGTLLDLHRGRPPVRDGGVLIVGHPTPWAFDPVQHPSAVDLFEQVLAEVTDPAEVEAAHGERYAHDEWYRHLYRTSYAYHGVHPLDLWSRAGEARARLGRVIVVGGDVPAVRRLGFQPASTLQDALEMASDVVGPDASLTHLHSPPAVMADVT